jgi:hypothetical protein
MGGSGRLIDYVGIGCTPSFLHEVFDREGVAEIFGGEPLKVSPISPVVTPLTPGGFAMQKWDESHFKIGTVDDLWLTLPKPAGLMYRKPF